MELHHSPTLSDITQLIREVIFLRTLNNVLQLAKSWTKSNLMEVIKALNLVESKLGSSTKAALGLLNGGTLTFNGVSKATYPGWADQPANTIHIDLAGGNIFGTVIHEVGHIVDWHARDAGSQWGWSVTSYQWQWAGEWTP